MWIRGKETAKRGVRVQEKLMYGGSLTQEKTREGRHCRQGSRQMEG